ncbi:hypothetical protein [Paenibacillus plantarum]|uniref:hypothetical protein n=1 Tax=Paenibacillus plantarum TaxID=2654975 RepID=UPI001FE3679B|nr:hypothetical protein [Paenibacillus plantarum]
MRFIRLSQLTFTPKPPIVCDVRRSEQARPAFVPSCLARFTIRLPGFGGKDAKIESGLKPGSILCIRFDVAQAVPYLGVAAIVFEQCRAIIYPYYLLFLKNLGSTYSAHGLAFAIFTISSAASAIWLGKLVDRSSKKLMASSSLGMMATILIFPWIPSYGFVLLLKAFMGVCNSM